MIWRDAVDFAGRRQAVAFAGELFAHGADGAAQHALDPLGHGREIGFAVERSKNGAAHESRAANAGQDRAGKPLRRDAAAVDHAAGPAVDRKRRLVAEIDRLGIGPPTVGAAQPTVVQSSSPALAVARSAYVVSRNRMIGTNRIRRSDTMPCRLASVNRQDWRRAAPDATLNGAPLLRFHPKNGGGMWLKCGARPEPCTVASRVKVGLHAGRRETRSPAANPVRFMVDNDPRWTI